MLTYFYPLVKAPAKNLSKAGVILSGLIHLKTNIFWKGYLSNFFQSKGNFTYSGLISLYHYLNLNGASFYKFIANISNP